MFKFKIKPFYILLPIIFIGLFGYIAYLGGQLGKDKAKQYIEQTPKNVQKK